MDTSIKHNIVKNAQAYITEHSITQVLLADKSGVPKEYLSGMLKKDSDFTIKAGKEKIVVIADKYFERLASFLGVSITNTYWDVKATPQLTTIIANLQDSKKYGATTILIGETGSGKSHTINLFAKRHPVDTFIVTVGSTDNTGDLIDKIVEALKIPSGKTKSRRLRQIASKIKSLKEQGYTPQLIFDESEYMKQSTLCVIKELHDLLNKFASLVLVGTDQLLKNIDTLRKRDKAGIPQFYRRIKFGIRVLPTIDRTFKLFLNELSPAVQKYLIQTCDNYGEVHDVIVPVRRESDRLKEEITINFIDKVLNLNNNRVG